MIDDNTTNTTNTEPSSVHEEIIEKYGVARAEIYDLSCFLHSRYPEDSGFIYSIKLLKAQTELYERILLSWMNQHGKKTN